MTYTRNTNLDILRFIAAFGVLMTHIGGVGGIGDYTAVGATCVKLFFILSGYLIFVSLDSAPNWRTYYKKRILSILPLYWSFLIIAALIDLALSTHFSISALAEQFSASGRYSPRFLTYFFGLQMFLPSSNWSVWNNRWNLWSISTFFLFYFIAPILHKVFKSFKVCFAFLFCILLVTRDFNVLFLKFAEKFPAFFTAETHMEWYASMNPYSEMYCFFFGIALYLARKEKKEFHYLFLIALMLIFKNFTWFSHELTYTLLTGVLLIAPPLFNNIKICSAISYLGKGSFALYLWHPFATSFINFFLPQNGLFKMCLIIVTAFVLSYGVYELTSRALSLCRRKTA